MKRIFFSALLLLSLNGTAQIALGINGFGFIAANDTVLGGTNDTFNVIISNRDSVAFNDVIGIQVAVQDTISPGLDTTHLSWAPGPVTILPGDSTSLSITNTYNISPSGYRYGIDVIVIWPVAPSAYSVDTLVFQVYIQNPNGIAEELDAIRLLNAYPNPAADKVTIRNPSGRTITAITVYDLAGRIVASNKGDCSINIEALPEGMYRAEVSLADKKRYSIPFIKGK